MIILQGLLYADIGPYTKSTSNNLEAKARFLDDDHVEYAEIKQQTKDVAVQGDTKLQDINIAGDSMLY